MRNQNILIPSCSEWAYFDLHVIFWEVSTTNETPRGFSLTPNARRVRRAAVTGPAVVCVASCTEAWLQESFSSSICVTCIHDFLRNTWTVSVFGILWRSYRTKFVSFAWPLGRHATKHVSRSMNYVVWILRVRTTWVHFDQKLCVANMFAHVSVTVHFKRFCGVSITVHTKLYTQMIILRKGWT